MLSTRATKTPTARTVAMAHRPGDAAKGQVALGQRSQLGDLHDCYVEDHHRGFAHELDPMLAFGGQVKKCGPAHSRKH
jgi:hypothetical protein